QRDGRCQHLFTVHAAVTFEGIQQTGDRTGNPGGQQAVDREVAVEAAVVVEEHVIRGSRRRALAVVLGQYAAVCQCDEHEAATTKVACRGVGDGQREGRGHCGVHGVATGLEDVTAHL